MFCGIYDMCVDIITDSKHLLKNQNSRIFKKVKKKEICKQSKKE